MSDDLVLPLAPSILARRVARIAFGTALLVGLAALVAIAVQGNAPAARYVPQVVGLIWVTALISGGVAYGLVRGSRVAPRAEQLFAASLMVPTAALALALPLTIHLGVAQLLGAVDALLPGRPLSQFAAEMSFLLWLQGSMVCTGLAHVVFAALCLIRVRQLMHGRAETMTPRRIFMLTVIASCVPFVVVVAPPVLVALTGLPILPLLRAMKPRIERERAELRGEQPLPRAVARPVLRRTVYAASEP
jgi:hypothetical protein